MLVQTVASSSRAMASAAKDDKYDFDLFTIGGGTGGVRAARFASMDYGMWLTSCIMLTTLDHALS